MAIRLTKHHPLTKKLRELEEFMGEKKISIEWNGIRIILIDNVTGEEAYIQDNESNENCVEIPWGCETKLVKGI